MPATPRVRASAVLLGALLFSVIVPARPARGQCTEKPPLQNYTGGGTSICPCFVAGEEAGAVFTAPAADYPIEILRVGIAWASQFGTSGGTIEDAIHIYHAGLPNPGPRYFTLPGPVLQDGAINEFNLEPLSGEILVPSGQFTVTLEFLISNAGDFFAPSVMTDGNGCQSGKNVIYANPGGWLNACSAGISGDWVFYVVYRPYCTSGVGEETVLASAPALLNAPSPNPFSRSTGVEFFLAAPGHVTLEVYDLRGARVAELADSEFDAGRHSVNWDGLDSGGASAASGIYFITMRAGSFESTRKVLLTR
jgi:hypothetical protein